MKGNVPALINCYIFIVLGLVIVE